MKIQLTAIVILLSQCIVLQSNVSAYLNPRSTSFIENCGQVKTMKEFNMQLINSYRNRQKADGSFIILGNRRRDVVAVVPGICLVAACTPKNESSDSHWIKDSHDVTATKNFHISFMSRALVIQNVTKKDDGYYQCVENKNHAKNGIVDSFQLEVKEPIIIEFLNATAAFVNSPAKLSAKIWNHGCWVNIDVYHNERRINHNHSFVKISLKKNHICILIDSVKLEHEGNYTLVGTHASGNISATAELVVKILPRWNYSAYESRTFKLSSLLNLTCSVYSKPESVISWYKKGIDGPLITGLGRVSYMKTKAERSDAGIYTCHAYYDNQQINETEVYVQIKSTPVITKDPDSRMFIASIHTWFTCEIDGDEGLYTATWTKIDRTFKNETMLHDETIMKNEQNYKARYKPKEIEDIVTGLIKCTIDTDYASSESLFRFYINEKPLPLRMIPVYDDPFIVLTWAYPVLDQTMDIWIRIVVIMHIDAEECQMFDKIVMRKTDNAYFKIPYFLTKGAYMDLLITYSDDYGMTASVNVTFIYPVLEYIKRPTVYVEAEDFTADVPDRPQDGYYLLMNVSTPDSNSTHQEWERRLLWINEKSKFGKRFYVKNEDFYRNEMENNFSKVKYELDSDGRLVVTSSLNASVSLMCIGQSDDVISNWTKNGQALLTGDGIKISDENSTSEIFSVKKKESAGLEDRLNTTSQKINQTDDGTKDNGQILIGLETRTISQDGSLKIWSVKQQDAGEYKCTYNTGSEVKTITYVLTIDDGASCLTIPMTTIALCFCIVIWLGAAQ